MVGAEVETGTKTASNWAIQQQGDTRQDSAARRSSLNDASLPSLKHRGDGDDHDRREERSCAAQDRERDAVDGCAAAGKGRARCYEKRRTLARLPGMVRKVVVLNSLVRLDVGTTLSMD